MQTFQTPEQVAQWLRASGVVKLRTDHRTIAPGDAFFAWPGAATDARVHVESALAAGAVACLVEQAGAELFQFTDPRVACVSRLKALCGPIASVFLQDPSAKLDVVAVTGTNGKTSITWWLAQALSNLPAPTAVSCGVVGTLGVGVPPHLETTGLTTPDPVALHAAFDAFATRGLRACAIEASSIGIEEHRLDGARIHTAVFTNLTQDHLDYHGAMAAYWRAKQKLFSWPGLRAAVVNVDDTHGAELASHITKRRGSFALDLWTVSMLTPVGKPARLQALEVCHQDDQISLTVAEGDHHVPLVTSLVGDYNIANVLEVIAAMRTLGVPLADAVAACARLTPVPGRMECVSFSGQPMVAVDYAHTPDALAKILDALRAVTQQRGGQLWCVFGCGGDRDNTKRPLMGAIAARHADRVVVTSDNPRREAPDAIIAQILLGMAGVSDVIVASDRALAIAQTVAQAQAQDVVLVAGKGHETYQEVAGQKFPFSDMAHVRAALAQRQGAHTEGGQP